MSEPMDDEDLAKLEAMRDATESEITRILLTALIDLHTGVGPEEVMDSLKANVSRAHTALLKQCLEVVGPFAKEADYYEPDEGDSKQRIWFAEPKITIGDLRRARALAAKIREAIG